MPSVTKDDPKQVLALLNSLGFIGITAEQLKGFMKDLKIYRKIEEKERDEWKDKMKKHILKKQHDELQKILTETANSQICDDPVVKIKFNCVSAGSNKSEEFENQISSRIISSKQLQKKEGDGPSVNQSIESVNRSKNQFKSSIQTKKIPGEIGDSILVRAASVPNLSEQMTKVLRPKSTCSEPTKQARSTSSRNPSRCSFSRSQSKSFIRPWKLHPDVIRVPHSLKSSDPVTLYHNYQKSWKQISFPGENRHADIRWAVREKMLGTDPTPTPRPIIKKSFNSKMSIIRR